MKKGRHSLIVDLIQRKPISTQEELLQELRAMGYSVTQATVSRDIKDLKLIKILSDNGKYIYALSSAQKTDIASSLDSLFSTSVLSVENAQNIVVIKTLPGMAQAVCASIDASKFIGIIGSIAGEDTIFLAADTTDTAKHTASVLKLSAIYEKNSR